jgi:hypothetical protein
MVVVFIRKKLHTNGFCLFCFLWFARRIFYPALFTLLYFIILAVAISFGKNWQTRAWDPVFNTAGSAPDAAMILGLFSQKNLKINIDRKLY